MYLKLTKDNIYKYISEYDIKIINNNINSKIKSYLFINITNDLQNVWLMINKNYILYVSNIPYTFSFNTFYIIILLININNIKFTIYSNNINSKILVLYDLNKTIRIEYREDHIHINKDGYNDKFIYSNYIKICNYNYINNLYYKYKKNHNKIFVYYKYIEKSGKYYETNLYYYKYKFI